MDDERKKPPLRRGPKASGGKSGSPRDGDRRKTGKAGSEKPFRSDKKPFAKRRDGETAGGDRPKRDFRRDDRPRDAGEGTFGSKARGQRSERQPFAKRTEGERGPRRFERTERNDGELRRERPFRGGPRPEGFERRNDRSSDEGRPRSFRRDTAEEGTRPPRGDRPFEKRGEGSQRPGRRERAELPTGERPKRMERPARGRPNEDRKPFVRRAEPAEAEPGERIAKRLARAGIASRRDAENLIAAGRVSVNGKVLASPAFNVLPEDRIELDGTLIPPVERTRLFLFHKPAGLVTTNRDPEGRRTVFDILPKELPRLMTVGRLDINTEGLLLLTNDGGLARVLELPTTGWLRRYRVRVHGKVDERNLAGLKDGIAVDGVFYGSVEASLDREQGTNAWLTIGLREGKNREVKNILGALGLEVTRLIRISYGPFQLGELPEGTVQELKGKMLRDQLGERLIEEAGANFEAPITKPFSNKPVRAERDMREDRPRRTDDGMLGTIGEGGLIKARKRRENSRDEALSRLSTRPDRGERAGARAERGARKSGEREQRAIEPPGGRKANVWMAPGARPQGKGRLEAEAAKTKAGKERKAGSKPFAKQRPDGAKGGTRPRGEGPTTPRRGKGDADRRR
ncbi:pseudouridine synthase [Mesorhizobium sp. 1B3]|uniref:pseudouridine synthase n=1 Tax=Mesorhizobium sp. 1B3 TaxID=3243599 RepID=UPI003D95AB02